MFFPFMSIKMTIKMLVNKLLESWHPRMDKQDRKGPMQTHVTDNKGGTRGSQQRPAISKRRTGTIWNPY